MGFRLLGGALFTALLIVVLAWIGGLVYLITNEYWLYAGIYSILSAFALGALSVE